MTAATPAYDALTEACGRIYRLEHLNALASWDQAAMMPPKANLARARALGELGTVLHRLRTDPAMGRWLSEADQEPLDGWQRANLREIRRRWVTATAWPESLVERQVMATSRCEHAWRSQRPANDWAGFAATLAEVVDVAREQAQRLGERLGLSHYDALMSLYEPDMDSARVAALFAQVRQWLPGLVAQVVERQAAAAPLPPPRGPFPVPTQHRLCEQVMGLLGFDFEGGRLDVSAHPFSGGSPEDVRLTTRFKADDCLDSLLSTIHETGHGRYEQNLPRDWLGQPVAEARSMALHESQSLSFEMQLAGHPGFAGLLAPLLRNAFGEQPAFEPETLHRLMTRVSPGLIRVEADELTYPAHVMLRFQIERALINGEVEVADIPTLWDEGMRDLLGLDTRGNYRDGPMQDVHWPSGAFGYFPCYTLGAMYAAQWFAAIRRAHPGVDDEIAGGQLDTVFHWLREHIWLQASRWTTDELTLRASGETLNPAHYRAHLERRYLA